MVNSRIDWRGDAATKAILDAAWEAILRGVVMEVSRKSFR